MTRHEGLFPETDYLLNMTHPLVEIDPGAITLDTITIPQMVAYQARASRAVWRPAPGRKNAYAVRHDGQTIGLLFLASPVINLGVRDAFLDLPTEGRGVALRRVADLSVCVGIQPLAWHWNLGKLVAMLATSEQVSDHHAQQYHDPLEWITTTSLYGRGTQYNRVYRFLGYTKGYGHAHITEDEYQAMLGVYIAPAAQGTVEAITREWHRRWGLPRYLRTRDKTPPYTHGIADA